MGILPNKTLSRMVRQTRPMIPVVESSLLMATLGTRDRKAGVSQDFLCMMPPSCRIEKLARISFGLHYLSRAVTANAVVM
jgi:hypothetical protein